MADLKRLRRNLPAPPAPSDASDNLRAPEIAPSDGRSARATGRTYQLATRVTPAFHEAVKTYAAQHRLKLVEVLEKAFDALKAQDRLKEK
jgi:hypothetical protein